MKFDFIPDSVSHFDNAYDVLKERGFIEQSTNEDEIRKLLQNEKVKFYIGFDPTADCLHVGHFMQVIIMMYMQKYGHTPVVLIGGGTGNGKTQLVCSRPDGIDLEGLAHHRGSSFGRTLQDQHPQATFENHLAVSLLKKAEQQTRWVLEDEGHMIGANHLPESLRLRMAQSPLAVVEDPFDVRLERLREEYFDRMYRDFIAAYGEEKGWQAYGEYLHHGLLAIRRRLGLQRFAQLTERLDEALVQQQRTASTEAHFAWLVPLLEEYYDPMYRYQLGKKAGKILFRGSWQEVAAWLAK